MEERMKLQLTKRRQDKSLRTPLSLEELKNPSKYDFSSNDYLGLARSCPGKVEHLRLQEPSLGGATGSRLLSGDSLYCRELELWLAKVHNQPTATIFNSGYDANLSILSSTLLGDDIVIRDELCHNSLIMGVRMSRLANDRVFEFNHNSVDDLKRLLNQHHSSSRRRRGCCLIVVESVYSMDGDVAPLSRILDLAAQYSAQVVVDEAHGLGIYGKTNARDLVLEQESSSTMTSSRATTTYGGTGVLAALGLEQHPGLLCSVSTFGKAAGCHGAVICGSVTLRQYLWNYARPLVYSTALPQHSLSIIRASYEAMTGPIGEQRRKDVFAGVRLFRELLSNALIASTSNISLWPSRSPIQVLLIPGNNLCTQLCKRIWNKHAIRLYPIRAPTVPLGQERVRIILHPHNSFQEIHLLVSILCQTLMELKVIGGAARL